MELPICNFGAINQKPSLTNTKTSIGIKAGINSYTYIKYGMKLLIFPNFYGGLIKRYYSWDIVE